MRDLYILLLFHAVLNIDVWIWIWHDDTCYFKFNMYYVYQMFVKYVWICFMHICIWYVDFWIWYLLEMYVLCICWILELIFIWDLCICICGNEVYVTSFLCDIKMPPVAVIAMSETATTNAASSRGFMTSVNRYSFAQVVAVPSLLLKI